MQFKLDGYYNRKIPQRQTSSLILSDNVTNWHLAPIVGLFIQVIFQFLEALELLGTQIT